VPKKRTLIFKSRFFINYLGLQAARVAEKAFEGQRGAYSPSGIWCGGKNRLASKILDYLLGKTPLRSLISLNNLTIMPSRSSFAKRRGASARPSSAVALLRRMERRVRRSLFVRKGSREDKGGTK